MGAAKTMKFRLCRDDDGIFSLWKEKAKVEKHKDLPAWEGTPPALLDGFVLEINAFLSKLAPKGGLRNSKSCLISVSVVRLPE